MNRLVALAIAVLAVVALPVHGDTLRIGVVTPQQIEQRLRSAPAKNEDRQQAIAQMFRDAGCAPEQLEIRKLKTSKFSNVVCTVRGSTDKVIVVGGHFDHVHTGDGIIDNWSGASMVANMIESLRSETRQHTFIFVAFAREEEGLFGSRDFVNKLTKPDIANLGAMVNIDSLGLGPAVVWRSHASASLFDAAERVAKAVHMKLDVVDVDGAGDGDSSPFKAKNIAVIDFHSLHMETFHILHSKDDNFGAVQMGDYADSFRLIANFLAYIDSNLP